MRVRRTHHQLCTQPTARFRSGYRGQKRLPRTVLQQRPAQAMNCALVNQPLSQRWSQNFRNWNFMRVRQLSMSRAHTSSLALSFSSDPLRATSKATLEWLSEHGVEDMVMVTGDMKGTAQAIAKELDFAPDQVYASMTPSDKVKIVQQLPAPTLMVGDGINDAPILATADVGIAMGARGATAASESATPSSLPKISLGWPTLCIFRNARLIARCSPSGLV